MFFRRRMIGLIAVGLLIFGVVGMARSSAYRAGWSQGFSSGQIAAGQQAPAVPDGDDTAVSPVQPPAYYGHGFSPFGWFIGGFFQLLLLFFLLSLVFRMFAWGRWRRRWHRHGGHHRYHGHDGPPWAGKRCGSRGRRDEKEPDKSHKERYYDEHGPDGPIVDM